jgi:hypothetical protein
MDTPTTTTTQCTCKINLVREYFNPTNKLCNLERRTLFTVGMLTKEELAGPACDYCSSFTVYCSVQGALFKQRIINNSVTGLLSLESTDCICGCHQLDVSCYGYNNICDNIDNLNKALAEKLASWSVCTICMFHDIYITHTDEQGVLHKYVSKWEDEFSWRGHTRLVRV